MSEIDKASMPMISAVLISWNRLDYLQKAIHSLRAQNYPNLEIVVVDNGSSDGSAEWLREQKEIVLIQNPRNRGASAARNQGTRIAQGAYVLYMDSDAELITPGALARMVRELEVQSQTAGAAGLIYADAELQKLWCCSPCMNWEGYHDPAASLQIMEQAEILSTCFSLFRHSALQEAGGFDEFFFYLYEDGDLCERLRKRGYRLRIFTDIAVVHHYAEPGRTRRGRIAFHYYHERLRMYYILKNWGLRRFLQSWASKVSHTLDFKKNFPYLPIMCYIDIYAARASLMFLAYPFIRARRKKHWI